jgi:hypothetical protein
MDEKDLQQLLHGRRNQVLRRGWRCPDEAKIAAYVGHQLEGPVRQTMETHLADCDYCLEQVSFLAQSADWTNFDALPPQLLSRARNLVPRRSASVTTWGWRWAVPAVAAACLVLLIALVAIFLRSRQGADVSSGPLVAQQHQPEIVTIPEMKPTVPAPTRLVPKPKSAEPSAPTLRSGARDLMPTLVTPRNGETVQRNKLQFRWESLADAEFYEIRVVTAEGDSVFETKTEDVHLELGREVQLQAGAKYFVSVRAHLRQGKTVKSSIVSFRVLE